MSEYVTKMGTKFSPELVKDLFIKVQGHSTLAKFANQDPMPMNGKTQWIIDSADGVQIVGESGKKDANEITDSQVVITPYKFVFQHRYSDEFKTMDEKEKLGIMKNFTKLAGIKLAEGLDEAYIHGIVPFTQKKASFYATGSLDGVVGITKAYNASKLDDDINDIINAMDADPTAIAFSKTAKGAMGNIRVNGVVQYPDFRNAVNVSEYAGIQADVNRTIAKCATDADPAYTDHVILGDFENGLTWGYAKEMPFEVIEYGDPDGKGRDLKAYNEVCLRLEAYVGFGILDPTRFAIIGDNGETPTPTETAEIRIQTVDDQGNTIEGANVTVQDSVTGTEYSPEDGVYHIPVDTVINVFVSCAGYQNAGEAFAVSADATYQLVLIPEDESE